VVREARAVEDPGYLVVTRWQLAGPGEADTARRRFRVSYGPLVSAQPGFRRWYLAATGVDELLTASLWDSRAAFEAAQGQLLAWQWAHLAALGARTPVRPRGAVVAHAGR
jgi:heme-degrading monooxygenase HmoA